MQKREEKFRFNLQQPTLLPQSPTHGEGRRAISALDRIAPHTVTARSAETINGIQRNAGVFERQACLSWSRPRCFGRGNVARARTVQGNSGATTAEALDLKILKPDNISSAGHSGTKRAT